MIGIFILFVIFAVGLPVILEERRHRGDNVLKRTGVEILESPSMSQLISKLGQLNQIVNATRAAMFGLLLFVVLLGLFGIFAKFLFRLVR
jgi:hypothetical protein